MTFDTNAAVGKENNYRIIAEDLAGNKTTIEQQFTFVPLGNGASEAPLPTLSVMLDERSDSGVKEDYITNINTLSFKGLATKGAKVSFDIEGKGMKPQPTTLLESGKSRPKHYRMEIIAIS